MGRTKQVVLNDSSSPRKPMSYRDSMFAVRMVYDENGEERRERMECSAGLTTIGNSDEKIFYANGETNAFEGKLLRVTIEGPKRDIVNLMFEAALKRIGFKVVK